MTFPASVFDSNRELEVDVGFEFKPLRTFWSDRPSLKTGLYIEHQVSALGSYHTTAAALC